MNTIQSILSRKFRVKVHWPNGCVAFLHEGDRDCTPSEFDTAREACDHANARTLLFADQGICYTVESVWKESC